MSLSPQWLDELRARVTLSAVVGRTVRLQKKGREFSACCPFHNEKSPSFYVNDEKGFYHCFGCGAHGDAIRWLTDQRGLSFMDAVRDLAAEAGLELPAPDPRAAQAAQQQAGLHEVMAAAQAWFVAQLAGPEGAGARAYLATRGFDAATQARFGFGYAPERRQALKAGLRQFPEGLLIEAGLRIAVEEREPYDRFRGRLMLPIEDRQGRVIAFGGRILDKAKTDAPKYLNSPDTPLFDKGRTLYNLHRAGPLARQSGRLVVVEGYMDAIAMAAAGFGACVAPLGTALTEQQLEMAWRLVETPVLCFDGDAAGQRAALRACTRALPLLRPAHSLAIVRMPPGQDPDDVLKAQGPRAMEALLAGAVSLLDVLWAHERDALPLNTPEAKAGLKARLMAHVETIADPDIKALYRRELLQRFSAFAFPRQDSGRQAGPAPFGPRLASRNRTTGKWTREPPPPPHPMPATAARLSRPAGNGVRQANLAAIAWGLARFPHEIDALAEQIHRLAPEHPVLDALLTHAENGRALEPAAVAPILLEGQLEPPEALRHAGMGFSFLDARSADSDALAELRAVIALLVERAHWEVARARAQRRYEADMSKQAEDKVRDLDNQLEDLEKRELEMRGRLGHMGDAQDTGKGDETHQGPHEATPHNTPHNTMAD